jgi:hypothetical protein
VFLADGWFVGTSGTESEVVRYACVSCSLSSLAYGRGSSEPPPTNPRLRGALRGIARERDFAGAKQTGGDTARNYVRVTAMPSRAFSTFAVSRTAHAMDSRACAQE